MIELRLRGSAAHHPGSIVLPLLVSDLPVFCRWRGEPAGERAARRDHRRDRPSRRRLVGVARRPEGLRAPRGAVRQRRRLGHRVLAHAALAAAARRALAGDRRDREAARRGAARRRGARRRLAPLAAEARRRADAAERSRGEGDVGRRRARRVAGRAAQRERAALRRARPVRPRRGLRGRGARRRLQAPRSPSGDPSSSSAAAVRLARPDAERRDAARAALQPGSGPGSRRRRRPPRGVGGEDRRRGVAAATDDGRRRGRRSPAGDRAGPNGGERLVELGSR